MQSDDDDDKNGLDFDDYETLNIDKFFSYIKDGVDKEDIENFATQ